MTADASLTSRTHSLRNRQANLRIRCRPRTIDSLAMARRALPVARTTRSWIALLSSALVCLGSTGVPADHAPSADRFMRHVTFLASEGLRGRGNGTSELERAADYIA